MSSHAQIGPQGAEIKLLTVPSLDGMVSVGKTHFIASQLTIFYYKYFTILLDCLADCVIMPTSTILFPMIFLEAP